MGIFKNYKRQAAWTRKQEEKVYEFIAEEMEKDIIRKGLMTKAIAESEGNKERAEGTYIKLRFQSIKDEFIIFEEFLEAIDSKHDNRQKERKLEINDFSKLSKKSGTHKYQYKTGTLIIYTAKNRLDNSYFNSIKLKPDPHFFDITINKCDEKPHYEGKVFNSFWDFEDFLKTEF